MGRPGRYRKGVGSANALTVTTRSFAWASSPPPVGWYTGRAYEGKGCAMNMLKRLQRMEGFTAQERAVAAGILEDPELFLRENGKQTAKRCYVSQATLYRLCEKVGCAGLADLKLAVTRAIESYRSEDPDFDFSFPIKPDESIPQVMHGLHAAYKQTLIAARNLLDEHEIERSVQALHAAQRIDIYTSAGNVNNARNFAYQMYEIGVPVNVPLEEYELRLSAAASDETHLGIVISMAGYGLLMESVARVLARSGTPVLLISAEAPTPLDQYATYHLRVPTCENDYHKIAPFSTRLALLYLMDLLFACYFEADYYRILARKMSYFDDVVDSAGPGLRKEAREATLHL